MKKYISNVNLLNFENSMLYDIADSESFDDNILSAFLVKILGYIQKNLVHKFSRILS